MITHEIVKHKPRWKVAVDAVVRHLPGVHTPAIHQQHPSLPVIQSAQGGMPFMGKLEYANYLKKLRMKIGDYVFFRTAEWPVGDEDYYKVVGIQEVYYLAEGNNMRDKQPRPYYLKNKVGKEVWAHDDQLVHYKCPEDMYF